MLFYANHRYLWIVTVILISCVCYSSSECENCLIIPRENYVPVNDGIGVIPKCCGISESLEPNPDPLGGSRCVNQNRSLSSFRPFIITNNATDVWNVSIDGMKIIVGSPSCTKYLLQPEENMDDIYYVFDNGTLLTPKSSPFLRNINLFCLEYFQNDETSKEEILPFVCFDENTSSRGNYYMYAIGLFISVPFLICTFLVYALIEDLHDLHGKCLCCHVLCLIFAFTSLAFVQILGDKFPKSICVATAFMIQFFFLAAFCWLSVMCFNTWRNVMQYLKTEQSKEEQSKYFIYYSVFSWFIPLLFFIITFISDSFPAIPSWYIKPQIGVTSCWFRSDKSEFPYFYGPIAVLIFTNVVFFVLTARELSENKKQASEKIDLSNTERTNFILDFKKRWTNYLQVFYRCLILFLVMGINWLIEVISWAAGGSWTIWIVFDIINSLQGVIIFCIFVLKKPVRNIVKKKLTEWNNKTVSDDEELQNMTSNNSNYNTM